jgi:hypothetical protein
VLTLGLWLYLDQLAIQRQFRRDTGLHWQADVIFHLMRTRQLLSLFTLGCAAYVLYQAVPWIEKFHDFRWLPG